MNAIVRQIKIEIEARQWQPGAEIKGVFGEHECKTTCCPRPCHERRRAQIKETGDFGVGLVCPGEWVLKDVLGRITTVEDKEFQLLSNVVNQAEPRFAAIAWICWFGLRSLSLLVAIVVSAFQQLLKC